MVGITTNKYRSMQRLTRKAAHLNKVYPERVLQFGGGNFLRAFVNWMLDVYNEKANGELGVLLVTPIERDNYTAWQEQDGLYYVLTRGYQHGQIVDEKHLVSCISRILHLYPRWEEFLQSAENPEMRFVISNTTEAGISFSPEDKMTDRPPNEFPAKLTLWLYRRYQHFNGDKDKGCILLPVELILENGENLRRCILQNVDNWGLEPEFKTWVNEANIFCNTLVDRIVPGISPDALPQEWAKLNREDRIMTQGEAFHLWVIEAPEQVQQEFPLDQVGLNVIFTQDLTPYRTRKVRILNGAHTAIVPVAYLYGLRLVREAVEDDITGAFLSQLLQKEVLPAMDMPQDELSAYADSVMERFKNPFIDHYLISIALNSFSKFNTRLLPTVLDYMAKFQQPPQYISFALACTLSFYKGSVDGETIPLNDDPEVLTKLETLWRDHGENPARIVQEVLNWPSLWGEDLTQYTGFAEWVTEHLQAIQQNGVKTAIQAFLG